MWNFTIFLRLLICLVFTRNSIEGLRVYPQQMDGRFKVPVTNSSLAHFSTRDALYSSWSEWTTCTSTCGVGVSSRKRSCLKNVYNAKGVSIPACHGDLVEHKICNLQICPPYSEGVREKQCSQHNNRVIGGKLVKEWVPTNEGPNPCELRCEAKSEKLVYGFGKVSNGTPCPQGVCLDGRCLQIGCDERLGSDVILDMCGVCGGRNASCVHYKDIYRRQPSRDGDRQNLYSEVVVIPVGARNLIIRQTIGKNLLALQDKNKGIIFNGESQATKYGGHYDIAGMAVDFLKLDNVSESLFVKGPITEELYVLVLLRNQNPGIYYEYWLRRQTYNHFRNDYSIRPVPIVNNNPAPSTSTTNLPFQTTSRPVPITRPHYHPTKPAFAYGYGEKPYRRKDAPIFRHLSSTTNKPAGVDEDKTLDSNIAADSSVNSESLFKKDVLPIYKPRYLSREPELGFYQTYRNVSNVQPVKSIKFDPELPVLTQQDSSMPNGRERFDNAIPNTLYNDKNYHPPKSTKTSRSASDIDKRIDKALKNYIPNGRLKYSFDSKDTDEVYLNSSGRFTPTPLSIQVLPLPDGKSRKNQKGRQKDGNKDVLKPRLTRGGACEPCPRNRNQTKHFCESDFVMRAQILDLEFLQGETRYEVEVKQSYKNTLSLLPKEYVWSPDTCRCPKLRQGKEYVIMGRIDNGYRKRESRLLVDKTCFVRTYNLKYARRLQKLRKDQTQKCKKAS